MMRKVVGLPTTHYRYHTSYSMTMAFMGMKKESKIDQVEDIWAAPQLTEAAFGVWLRKGPPKTGDEQLDALISAEMGKLHGVPLKTVPIPDATFMLPAGYTETQLFPTGEESGQGKSEENPLAKLFGGKKKG